MRGGRGALGTLGLWAELRASQGRARGRGAPVQGPTLRGCWAEGTGPALRGAVAAAPGPGRGGSGDLLRV